MFSRGGRSGNIKTVEKQNKQFDQAIKSFKKAIEIEPLQARFHKSLGFTYDTTGKHEESITCFKKAIELEEHS